MTTFGSTGNSRATSAPDALADRLHSLLGRLVSRAGVPHAVIAVASGDARLRWVGAAGDARPDGTPMLEQTPFFIASVDKLFTATVILKLCERGDVGLNEPISDYLPKTLIAGLHQSGAVDYTPTITVRHLLSHTSGLADWLEDRPKRGPSIAERLMTQGDLSITLEDLFDLVRDQLPPHFPPQPEDARKQEVRYSDTNFMLLIAIIEAVTGRPVDRVHDELLFRPLAMRHTWIAGRSTPRDPTPAPALLWADGSPLELPRLMHSIRGVYSTVGDTLTFMRALVDGSIFDEPATLASMHQRWNRFAVPVDRAALRLPSWPIEYGLGIMRFHDPLLRLLGRLPRPIRPIYPAPAVLGHTGSTGSWLFHCPKLDLLLSGTVDEASSGAVPFRVVPKILQVVDDTYHHGTEFAC